MSAKTTKVRTTKALIENLISEDGRFSDLFEEAVRYQRDANAILRSATTDSEVAEAELRNGFYRDTAKRMQRYVMIHWGQFLDSMGITSFNVRVALIEVLSAAVHAA